MRKLFETFPYFAVNRQASNERIMRYATATLELQTHDPCLYVVSVILSNT